MHEASFGTPFSVMHMEESEHFRKGCTETVSAAVTKRCDATCQAGLGSYEAPRSKGPWEYGQWEHGPWE